MGQQSIIDWAVGGFVLVIFAYIIFVTISEFCRMNQDFCSIGWYIFGAFLVGIVMYLKFGWR